MQTNKLAPNSQGDMPTFMFSSYQSDSRTPSVAAANVSIVFIGDIIILAGRDEASKEDGKRKCYFIVISYI